MAAITWRNVSGGPDYRGAAYLMRGAQDNLQGGLDGLSNILQDRLKLQDENRANTLANNEAQIRRMITGAGSTDELNQLQQQGTLEQAVAQFGPHGVSRDFDPNALFQGQQDLVRGREVADQQFQQAEAERVANPIFQEYQALLIRDPEAAAEFLTPEREDALKKAMLFDNAAESQDSRQQTLADRAYTETERAERQKERNLAAAQRQSLETAARIQEEEMARGGEPRDILKRVLKRAGKENSGVLPQHMTTLTNNTRSSLDSWFDPFAKEREQQNAALAENALISEQDTGATQSRITSIDAELESLSPSLINPREFSRGALTEELISNYDMDQKGWDAIADLAPNIESGLKAARPLVAEWGLDEGGLTAADIVLEAVRMSAEAGGKNGKPRVSMRDVENQYRNAAASLAEQLKRYNTLTGQRTALQDQLSQQQLNTLRENSRIQSGNGSR